MEPSRESNDIAVIGLAGRFPGAAGIPEFWQNLRDGVESVTTFGHDMLRATGVTEEQLRDPDYVRAGSVLDGHDLFDAGFFGYNARDAALIDPQQRLFLESAWHALEDAGYPPGGFDGPVGVYASANLSTYLLACILAGRAGFSGVGEALELIVANDKDYLANRVGFKLGLNGPAVAVQSACSSSLVAVHLACQSLLSYECDMALAGGVALRVPHHTGYRYQDGLIFSRTGHCRPFDARADGTLAGNGLGLVVLRRLEDALADGDRVDAVIRGSAVNNDGSDKAGYTAPGIGGQASVIATALGIAQAEPESVSAVEAHGTGTPLGDPIEIAALTKVFGTGPGDRCAIGSVKSNLGHLDSAAGIAGLIKAVLQLRHGELVPSLNFDQPNPEIDFDRTPFYVNTELTEWKANGHPRRIGVSSFGMGGTNAHLVLEEAPERAPAPAPRAVHLLPLSARTPEALAGTAAGLAEALTQDGHPAVEDVAHTLQHGRTVFEHRRVLVAGSTEEAAEAAGALAAAGGRTQPVRGAPRTAWLFTGQGSQYPGMCRGVYDAEPVFREAVDACAELLRPEIGTDLREVLYPDASVPRREAAQRLRRTEFAQPALFTVEYALAVLLESWGLRPDAMAGHSVGEITAACVAGVLPWEDAARLVARRGRLMQELPSGAMLSVNLPEERVRELLPGTLDLAAVNGPALCVVSGPHEEVDAFRERLTEQGHAARPLHTSHAFHSSMTEPILEPFAAELESLRLSPPRVRFVSNRTGTWITDEQATDPAYWAGHVRDTVRFGDAVQLLAGSTDPLALLEIGPGHTLSTLARQCEDTRRATVLHTVPAPDDDTPGHPFLLTAAGRMWSAGLELDWHALNGGGRRVSLPGYAFQRRRYWIEPAAGTGDGAAPLSVIAPADDPADTSDRQPFAADPRPDLTTAYCAPRDAAEERLAAIWQDLLGIEPVGVHDHFMELGGHSLLATRMVDRIAAEFGRRLPLREVLRAATVAELAELTGPAPAEGDGGPVTESGLPAAVPDPGNLYEPFPLSEMQQAQWIGRLASFQGGDTAAHVYWEVESDDLDLERLNHAFNLVMDRHEMLRAIVTPDGTQRILPDVGPYPFEVLDLRAEPEETVAERLDELRERLSHEVRPTDTWPLFDIRATVLPGDRVRLHIGFDLLIADIGSIRLLLADWRRWYENPDAELPRLALSYRDYVLASEAVRETEPYRRSVEYWRERVADLPPAPDLPLAISPDALSRPEFTARTGLLGAEEWERFTDRCASLGLTPSSALLAAYATALGGWTRNGRFTLNVTVINRLPLHPDVSSLVGEFASFDLLPVDLFAADGTAELARQIQAQSWEDLEHRYLNGVEVLRELARSRGGTSGSVMPVVFTSTLVQENDPDDTSMFGWLGEMTHQIAQTPQVWLDFAVLSADGGVELTWHWVRDLFPEGALEDVFDAFHGVVRALAAETAAWDATPTLLPEGQRELVAAANDTAGRVPDGLLFTPLTEQALHHPDRPAVFSPTGDLTHGELYRQACGVAHRLRGLGVGPNRLVAVAADKSREQIVAALGVQLAGGAYLPVDPDLPKERQDWLLDHGQARVVLTRAGGPDREDWPESVRRVVVDLDAGEGADEPPEPVQQPGDLAYVVYTSGSTGTPKGVMVSHRAALNTVVDINERFGVGPEDRVLGLSSLSFDLSVWDVFGVLGAGGALVLPPSEDRRSPERWHRLVNEHRVTVWNSVPALAQMFTDQVAAADDDEPAPPLRLALMSGDWIPVDLPDRMRALMPGLEPVSLGGATEAAVWSIAYPIGEVDPGWDSIPYGRPLRNQTFHVLNDRMAECPVWVTGELYIGGVGLAEGYWREPERTAAQFVTHPETGERLYRTGDLGRRLPDGNLEFLGREDFQVKIGGYRIELGEIETVLAQHDEIAAAVATAHGTDRHHRRLVGYLVPDPAHRDAAHDDEEAFTERIRAHAQERLPSYMVPAVFVVLDRLPLSNNGKVDRGALPEPGRRREAAAVDDAVLEGALGRLAEIIAEVVGVPQISATENFFELGGDSITGVQIVSRANSEGIDIALQDLFQAQTLGALAAELGDRLAGGGDPAGAGGQAPLTGFQHRLFAQAAPEPPGGAHGVEVKVEACVDSDGAGRALGALLERHPALRLRFTEQDGTVVQTVAETDDEPPYVPEIDLTMLPADRREPAMAEMVGELREELDPGRGPVVQAALFDLGDDDRRMAWLAHELVADAGSWKVLLAEFFGTLALLDRDAPLPPPPTGSFLPWARQLPGAPQAGRDDGGSGSTPERALLPAPGAAADTAVHRAGTRMDAQETAAVLDAAREAYRMTLDEVLLASVAEALRTAGGPDRFGVDVEFDPRAAVEEFDAAPVVGPFAAVIGVPLDLSQAREPDALLGEVKLRYREAADAGRFAGAGAAPPAAGEVLLRSLGDFFPSTGSGGHPLAAASRAPWPVLHGRQDATHTVTVTAVVFQGSLHTEWAAAGGEQAGDLVEALAAAQQDALRRIRTHCEEAGPVRLRPGDFPLAGLDDNELGVVLDDLFAEEDAR